MASFAPEAAPAADVFRSCASYVSKLLRPRDKAKEISGMKCLLLDKETVRIYLSGPGALRTTELHRSGIFRN